MTHGRIRVDGKDQGAGFVLTRGIVVTAHHVLKNLTQTSSNLTFATLDREFRLGRVRCSYRPDEDDIAVLPILDGDPEPVTVGRAVKAATWRVVAGASGGDPELDGRVHGVVQRRDDPIPVLQLYVTSGLGNYRGYSGSAVRQESPDAAPPPYDAVVGVLVEQVWQRLSGPGGPKVASNVLYVVPIEYVQKAFDFPGIRAARPHRYAVTPAPDGAIERMGPLTTLRAELERASRRHRAMVLVRGIGGTGKSVLCRQAIRDETVWRAFPGGVVEVVAGPDGTTRFDALRDRLAVLGNLGCPALAYVDDIWSDDLPGLLRQELSDNVTILATSRGIHAPGAAPIDVDCMTDAEAIAVLADGTPVSDRLTAEYRRVIGAVRAWPLLLHMAARQIHPAEGAPTDADVLEEVRRLADDLAADPDVLADREQSLDHMVERSLAMLPEADRTGFAELTVFPHSTDLTETILGTLWQVSRTVVDLRMARLRRVGLVTATTSRPRSMRLHDLIVDWLHRRYGGPDHSDNRRLHIRYARVINEPAALTEDHARLLAFHLCRTGRLDDPAQLADTTWIAAFRRATRVDATYLEALQTVLHHYAAIDDPAVGAPMLRALLAHARAASRVGSLPVDALVALSLLESPDEALRQVSRHPRAAVAARAIGEILTAADSMPPTTLVRAVDTATMLPTAADRATAFAGIARALASDPTQARDLLAKAVKAARADPSTRAQRACFHAIALVMADLDRDVDRAREVAEHIAGLQDRQHALWDVVARSPDANQARALLADVGPPHVGTGEYVSYMPEQFGAYAAALVRFDVDGALAFVDRHGRADPTAIRELAVVLDRWARTDPPGAASVADGVDDAYSRCLLRSTVAAAAAASGHHTFAADLAGRAESDSADIADDFEIMLFRTHLLPRIVKAVVVSDARRAETLAGSIVDDSSRHEALAHIARVVACEKPEQARALIQRIEDETPVSPAHLCAVAELARALAVVDTAASRAVARAALDATATVHTDERSGDIRSRVCHLLAPVAPDLIVPKVRDDPFLILAFLGGATLSEIDYALPLWPEHRWWENRWEMLAEIVRLLAERDPAEAIECLHRHIDPTEAERAWRAVLQSLTVSSPDFAEYLLTHVAPRQLSTEKPGLLSTNQLTTVLRARTLAVADPAGAAAIVAELPDPAARARAYAKLAVATAPHNPDQAIEYAAASYAEASASTKRRTTIEGWLGRTPEAEPDREPDFRCLASVAETLGAIDRPEIRAVAAKAGTEALRGLADPDVYDQLSPTAPTIVSAVASIVPEATEKAVRGMRPDTNGRREAMYIAAEKMAAWDVARALTMADDLAQAAGANTREQSRRWAMATALGHAAAHHREQRLACIRHCWSDMPSALGFAQGYLEAAQTSATHTALTAIATAIADTVESALPTRPQSTVTT